MENVNENVSSNNNTTKENVNIKCFARYIYKNLSIIAIVLSIISIIFSTFAFVNVSKRPGRDFRAERPYDVQANVPDGCFNGGNFGGPNNSQFYGQKPNKGKQMRNGNRFNGSRQGNNQNGGRNFNNDSRFNKPNNGQNGNKNNSKGNNNLNPPSSTSDSGPKVAPEVSPSK